MLLQRKKTLFSFQDAILFTIWFYYQKCKHVFQFQKEMVYYKNIKNFEINTTIQLLLLFITTQEDRLFLISCPSLQKKTIQHKQINFKIFYVYRLTLIVESIFEKNFDSKLYYSGYRSCSLSPFRDTGYISSSKEIKTFLQVKSTEKTSLRKKFQVFTLLLKMH